jgi:hypothetical protein
MTDEIEKPMTGGNEAPRLSFLRMEKHRMGELSADESAEVAAEISGGADAALYQSSMDENKSSLTWAQLRRRINEEENPGRMSGLLARLDAWLPRPSRAVMAWGGALCLLLLVLPVALMTRTSETGGLRAKGSGRAEVLLSVGDREAASGQTLHSKSGDVLTFSYRSIQPVFAQIWYVEDGSAPAPFAGKEDEALSWPASSSWRKAPQRIMLDGNWKSERVIIVTSTQRLQAEDARRLASGGEKPKKGAEVFIYELSQP